MFILNLVGGLGKLRRWRGYVMRQPAFCEKTTTGSMATVEGQPGLIISVAWKLELEFLFAASLSAVP